MKKLLSVLGAGIAAISLLTASACGGEDTFDLAYEDEGLEQDVRFAPPALEALPVYGADLVGEIIACGNSTVTVRIRNRGDVATDAEACSVFYCVDKFETRVSIGRYGTALWTDDLAPGEAATYDVQIPDGFEGLVTMRVDTWGSNPGHSVAESNENNNVSEMYCVL